jgi:c(7)-type cytochrome triheme protein
MLKNAHLRRSPHPSSLQRTCKYASLLRISGALHLGIFEHPGKNYFFSSLLMLEKAENILRGEPVRKITCLSVVILILGLQGRAFATGGEDILFNRSPLGPVVFSHNRHVQDHNLECDQCHPGLYPTQGRSKPVGMSEMFDGKSCGACHNGRKAFAVQGDCSKCHKLGPS